MSRPAAPPNTLFVNAVELAALVTNSQLVVGYQYVVGDQTDGGTPYIATSKNTYAGSTPAVLQSSFYENLLLIDASTGARTRCQQAVESTSVAVTAGGAGVATITFDLKSAATYPMHVGHRFRMASNPYPEIEGTWEVTSFSGGGSHFVAKLVSNLIKTAAPAGTYSGNSVDILDLQCGSATCNFPGMLNILLGGRLNIIPLCTGSTNIADWTGTQRKAQIREAGPVPCTIIGLCGNDLRSAGHDAQTAIADLKKLIDFLLPQSPNIIIMGAPALSDQASAGNGSNTGGFVAGSRYNIALYELVATYPGVKIVSPFAASAAAFGSTTTTDITDALAPRKDKADDGVHNLWGEAWTWAEVLAPEVARYYPERETSMLVRPNSSLVSSVAEQNSSGKYLRNLAEGMIGTVTSVGGVPNTGTPASSGLGSATYSNEISLRPDRGSDWISTFNSNGTTAGSTTGVEQYYTGASNSLLAQLNDPKNQGVPIDIFWPAGVYGFNDYTMNYVELVLEGDNGDGQGMIPIAGAFCERGQFLAPSMTYTDASKGTMAFGWYGVARFPRFTIPLGTSFTSVRVRQTARPQTGADAGIFNLRLGPDPVIRPLN